MKKWLCLFVMIVLGFSSVGLAQSSSSDPNVSSETVHPFMKIIAYAMYGDIDLTDEQNDILVGLYHEISDSFKNDYTPSELPEWDVDFTFGGGSIEADDRDVAGLHYESDITTMYLGMSARKDRFMLGTVLHREKFEGRNAFRGVDSENIGVLFKPGYRIWTQQENGLGLNVYGLLDVSYMNNDPADNAWYVTPGARVEATRGTPVGLFRGAYTFNHARNIDGDREITNESHIVLHGWLLDYMVPLTKTLYARTGINHAMVSDMPTGVDDDYTALIVGLGTLGTSRWNLRGNYFEAIDGRNDRGFTLELTYGWK